MQIKTGSDRVRRAGSRQESLRSTGVRQREVAVRVADVASRPAHKAYLQQQIGPALAHELSQPLTSIANYASACRRFLHTGGSESAHHALRAVEAILEEAQRGAQIVRRMRACLMESATVAESFELDSLVVAVVGKASVAATDVGVSIVREGPQLRTNVRADAVLIQQVLLNLIYNALDAIREGRRGKGSIRIGTCMRADGFAEIAVIDDGVGVAGSMKERIFEPAVTTKREGTGIGLTICRSIVEAHGGRLWAESNRRSGTTFKFTLPAAAAA